MIKKDIERIEQVINGLLDVNVLLPNTIQAIWNLAIKKDYNALRTILDGSKSQIPIKDYTQLLNTKKGLVETYIKLEYANNQGLSKSEFQTFLNSLMGDLRKAGNIIPDHWSEVDYWRRIIDNAKNSGSTTGNQ
jgi:hypothetical protein